MKRVLLLLPMLLLVACEPAEPTAAEVAEKLQSQINELLEEVDESLKKVADLDLDGLCANSGRITAGMDLLVPRYRAFAVLMEELGDMQQALLAGGAANQFAVDVQKIRRDCATRAAAPSTRAASEAPQSSDKTISSHSSRLPACSSRRGRFHGRVHGFALHGNTSSPPKVPGWGSMDRYSFSTSCILYLLFFHSNNFLVYTELIHSR